MKRAMVALFVVLFFSWSCGESRERVVIGKWRKEDGTILEFFSNGKLIMFDEENPKEHHMEGTYRFIDKNKIRIIIPDVEKKIGPIIAEVSPSGEELSVSTSLDRTGFGFKSKYVRIRGKPLRAKKVEIVKEQNRKTKTSLAEAGEKETRKQTKEAEVIFSKGVFRTEDFYLTLSQVARATEIGRSTHRDIAYLTFTIVKIKEGFPRTNYLVVKVEDDHGNNYQGKLALFENNPIFRLLPAGFAYVKSVEVQMPETAPIKKIQIGDSEKIEFAKIRQIKPSYTSFLKGSVEKKSIDFNRPIQLGKYSLFRVEKLVPDIYTWGISLWGENKDYNENKFVIYYTVQTSSGKITPVEKSETFSISGLSRRNVLLKIRSGFYRFQVKIFLLE